MASTLPTTINSDEPLARYILSSNSYSRTKDIVKPTLFMPPSNRELSVYRIQELNEGEIVRLGKENVCRPSKEGQQRNLHGFARFNAKTVLETDLDFLVDNEPERHANIIGWPSEKSAQKSIAQVLASKATLHL